MSTLIYLMLGAYRKNVLNTLLINFNAIKI